MPSRLGGLAHAILDFGLRDLSQPHAESDVRIHVEMRKERVVLEDHRDVAVVRQLVGYVLAVEQDLSFGGDLEPGDDAHRRRLAAARRARRSTMNSPSAASSEKSSTATMSPKRFHT